MKCTYLRGDETSSFSTHCQLTSERNTAQPMSSLVPLSPAGLCAAAHGTTCSCGCADKEWEARGSGARRGHLCGGRVLLPGSRQASPATTSRVALQISPLALLVLRPACALPPKHLGQAFASLHQAWSRCTRAGICCCPSESKLWCFFCPEWAWKMQLADWGYLVPNSLSPSGLGCTTEGCKSACGRNVCWPFSLS